MNSKNDPAYFEWLKIHEGKRYDEIQQALKKNENNAFT